MKRIQRQLTSRLSAGFAQAPARRYPLRQGLLVPVTTASADDRPCATNSWLARDTPSVAMRRADLGRHTPGLGHIKHTHRKGT